MGARRSNNVALEPNSLIRKGVNTPGGFPKQETSIKPKCCSKATPSREFIHSPYDGSSDASDCSEHEILRKPPPIPPRTSSLRAFIRSKSSEALKTLEVIDETPSRRNSSLSSPSGVANNRLVSQVPPATQDSSQILEKEASPGDLAGEHHKPTYITLFTSPQVSLHPTITTPVIVIPKDENPFDLASTLEADRVHSVNAGSIDPITETKALPVPKRKAEGTQSKDLLGIRTAPRSHVGWRSDFLEIIRDDDVDFDIEAQNRRRSSSLPNLQTSSGKEWKSVKGRRATPWVHNVGIGGNNGNSKGGQLAFPTLKRLSEVRERRLNASARRRERRGSGFEVWYDAVERQ